ELLAVADAPHADVIAAGRRDLRTVGVEGDRVDLVAFGVERLPRPVRERIYENKRATRAREQFAVGTESQMVNGVLEPGGERGACGQVPQPGREAVRGSQIPAVRAESERVDRPPMTRGLMERLAGRWIEELDLERVTPSTGQRLAVGTAHELVFSGGRWQ